MSTPFNAITMEDKSRADEIRAQLEADTKKPHRHTRSRDTLRRPPPYVNLEDEKARRLAIVIRKHPDGLTYKELRAKSGVSEKDMSGSKMRLILGARGFNFPRRRMGWGGHWMVWPSAEDMERVLKRKGIEMKAAAAPSAPDMSGGYIMLHPNLFKLPGAPVKEWQRVLEWERKVRMALGAK